VQQSSWNNTLLRGLLLLFAEHLESTLKSELNRTDFLRENRLLMKGSLQWEAWDNVRFQAKHTLLHVSYRRPSFHRKLLSLHMYFLVLEVFNVPKIFSSNALKINLCALLCSNEFMCWNWRLYKATWILRLFWRTEWIYRYFYVVQQSSALLLFKEVDLLSHSDAFSNPCRSNTFTFMLFNLHDINFAQNLDLRRIWMYENSALSEN